MTRSTNQHDYQHLSPAVVVMSKTFEAGSRIAPHSHPRDQLLYAVSGTMRVRTADVAWIVPPDRALYLPGGTEHAVAMRSRVAMRTLYIVAGADARLPRSPAVLLVGGLLRALVLALLEEPMAYDEAGRGGHVAWLILDEIARGRPVGMSIPMPRDKRLLRVCEQLLDDPAQRESMDRFAETAGASPRTLARLFQRECGMPFTAWRQRVRFHDALEALATGAAIGEVARLSGYASASAFTAAFRRTFGSVPSRLKAGAG